MKIFYIDLNKLDINILDDFIVSQQDDFLYKNILKKKQHYAGIYIIKNIAEKFYNIKNPQIIYENKKPYLKNSNLKISVSHSENIIVVAFDTHNIGIDIENNQKKRNFEGILKRISENNEIIDFKNSDFKKQFYDIWTKYEAKIKLNSPNEEVYIKYNYDINGFTLCIVSEYDFESVKPVMLIQ